MRPGSQWRETAASAPVLGLPVAATGHWRTNDNARVDIAALDIGLAGVDNDGRPTDWRHLACYRCCGSVGKYVEWNSNHLIHITNVKYRQNNQYHHDKNGYGNIEIASSKNYAKLS